MSFHRTIASGLIASLAAVSSAYERGAVEAAKPRMPDRLTAAQEHDAVQERLRARREFIAAREEFADALASLMTTEQLAARVRELSVENQLDLAQERLNQVRRRLREVEAAGRGDSDEARRLKERAAKLETEVASRESFLVGFVREQDEAIVTKVIVGQLQKEMAAETEYLADVLETSELSHQATQLRQIAKFGQLATGLKSHGDQPALIQDEPPEIATELSEARADVE